MNVYVIVYLKNSKTPKIFINILGVLYFFSILFTYVFIIQFEYLLDFN